MSKDIRVAGADEGEVSVTIDGGSCKRPHNGDVGYTLTAKIDDQEIYESDQREILHELIGLELVVDMEDGSND